MTTQPTDADRELELLNVCSEIIDAGSSYYSDRMLQIAFALKQRLTTPPSQPVDRDAYEGAREDLLDWKRRALKAEAKLREANETNSRLCAALNDENGPTHMGEPVIHSLTPAEPVDAEKAFDLAFSTIKAADWLDKVELSVLKGAMLYMFQQGQNRFAYDANAAFEKWVIEKYGPDVKFGSLRSAWNACAEWMQRTHSTDSRAAVPDEVLRAVKRMCKPLDPSRLSGVTAQEDARCMNIIFDFITRLAATPTQQAVPDGMKLVPVEPTDAMLEAMYWMVPKTQNWVAGPKDSAGWLIEGYKSMIAAAPSQESRAKGQPPQDQDSRDGGNNETPDGRCIECGHGNRFNGRIVHAPNCKIRYPSTKTVKS